MIEFLQIHQMRKLLFALLGDVDGSIKGSKTFNALAEGLKQIGKDVEDAYGCTVTIHFSSGYPAVMNPEDLYRSVKRCASFTELETPFMTAEDFSWYQRYIPGMFFFLGTGSSPALHNDRFDFDETVLERGADFFEKLAEAWI